MKLNELSNNLGAKRDKKRFGRGIGSGKGKTCGRGVKGQKSRSGVAIKGFEGGQMPMIKRLPKRGFNCPSSKKYSVVDIDYINFIISKGNLGSTEIITKEHLVAVGLIKNITLLVKLLSSNNGKLNSPVSLQLDAYSMSAKHIVEVAGGRVL